MWKLACEVYTKAGNEHDSRARFLPERVKNKSFAETRGVNQGLAAVLSDQEPDCVALQRLSRKQSQLLKLLIKLVNNVPSNPPNLFLTSS